MGCVVGRGKEAALGSMNPIFLSKGFLWGCGATRKWQKTTATAKAYWIVPNFQPANNGAETVTQP